MACHLFFFFFTAIFRITFWHAPYLSTTRTEEKILTVEVKKGWKEGTKITFPKEGDEMPTNIPADVVFMVKDKPHPVYKRDGSDIIYPAKICSTHELSS
uniref:Chaperone DnaJ C-terminal domain-containing protein n=1 Tax=Cyprinus carpio TaxID=7962 RepID=A0A8C1VXX8_CYPCA